MVDDEDLLARSLVGDASAFAVLVERHGSAVCAVSFAVTGDRSISERFVWSGSRPSKAPYTKTTSPRSLAFR